MNHSRFLPSSVENPAARTTNGQDRNLVRRRNSGAFLTFQPFRQPVFKSVGIYAQGEG